MKIRTNNKVAIEAATYYHPLNSLKLLGTEALYKSFPELEASTSYNSKDHSFLSNYGFDSRFFYKIERYQRDNVVAFEIGVGHLTNHDNNIILRRSQPLYFQYRDEPIRSALDCNTYSFICKEGDTLLVTTHIPTTLVECFTDENMVIVSKDRHVPHPVYLNKHSVLGRVGEEDIDSVNIYDLPSVAQSVECIQDAPKVKGLIVYDEEWDILKYYNGNEWREIG